MDATGTVDGSNTLEPPLMMEHRLDFLFFGKWLHLHSRKLT